MSHVNLIIPVFGDPVSIRFRLEPRVLDEILFIVRHVCATQFVYEADADAVSVSFPISHTTNYRMENFRVKKRSNNEGIKSINDFTSFISFHVPV